MTHSSLWLVGTIVPLAVALATFSVLYFRRYKQYLLEKNTYADCQFLEDMCRGYVFARIAHQKSVKNKFWWYFFGSRYIDLVNFYCERFLYELDKLNQFEAHPGGSPIFRRTSFMSQWKEMHSVLFTTGYGDRSQPLKFCEDLGKDPFGWMSVMIGSKLRELYTKHALQILRKRGYYEFNRLLTEYYGISQQHPHNSPFSAIHREITASILRENSDEVGERIRHDMNEIVKGKKILDAAQISALKDLSRTFVVRNKEGNWYGGISVVSKEIYDLLEQEKAHV